MEILAVENRALGRVFYPERRLIFHKTKKTNLNMYFVKFFIVPTDKMV